MDHFPSTPPPESSVQEDSSGEHTGRRRTQRKSIVTKNQGLAAIEAGLQLVNPDHESPNHRKHNTEDDKPTPAELRENRGFARPIDRSPEPEKRPNRQSSLPSSITRRELTQKRFVVEDHESLEAEAVSDGDDPASPSLRCRSGNLEQQVLESVPGKEKVTTQAFKALKFDPAPTLSTTHSLEQRYQSERLARDRVLSEEGPPTPTRSRPTTTNLLHRHDPRTTVPFLVSLQQRKHRTRTTSASKVSAVQYSQPLNTTRSATSTFNPSVTDIDANDGSHRHSPNTAPKSVKDSSRMSQAAREFGVTTGYQTRSLRACMVCSIIRPQADFFKEGCPNCEEALQMAGSNDVVGECTSSNFNGIIALMDAKNSWVARYHRLDGYKPGMYAVQVVGNLSEDTVEMVRAAGMRFVRRDGRKDEDEQME